MPSGTVARKPARRKKKLPPGQRLILAMTLVALAVAAINFVLPNGSYDAAQTQPLDRPPQPVVQVPFQLSEPLTGLEQIVKDKCDKQTKLRAGVFLVEPSTGRYLDYSGHSIFPAASIIKFPVLVKLMRALDTQAVTMDQKLVIRQDLIGGGSGFLQWRPPGSKISLRETAELMMIHSDNTATNMIIDLLGGNEAFNQDFLTWGLVSTRINNFLPDLSGTNTISPYDMVFLVGRIDAGELISESSRNWMYSVMKRNRTRTLLPMGIPPGTVAFHKTGDIGKLVGDSGVIVSKDGKRYLITVQVERPHNDRRANQLIREISKEAYIAVTGDAEGAKHLLQPVKYPVRKHKRVRHRKHRRR